MSKYPGKKYEEKNEFPCFTLNILHQFKHLEDQAVVPTSWQRYNVSICFSIPFNICVTVPLGASLFNLIQPQRKQHVALW